MTATTIDQAIEILGKTHDGSDLAPHHMTLIEAVVSAGRFDLTEQQEVALSELHAAVSEGRYSGNAIWLHGIEHLTKNDQGYVYWKGIEVEHYSFTDPIAEKSAALALAQRCLTIESKGFPVNCRSVLDQKFLDAPEGTPWLPLLLRLYSICLADGKARWLFLSKPGEHAVAITKTAAGTLETRHYGPETDGSGCYTAFHALEREGSAPGSIFTSTYESLIAAVQAGGFTPADIEQALA